MNVNEVIKYPILTEKTYQQMHEDNVYTFAVDNRTNKVEVKKAVEFIFNVKVNKVNILKVDAKPKRIGRFSGYTSSYKKAMVYLAKGNEISYFPDEEVKDKKVEIKDQKVKKDQQQELSEAEKRAAAKIAKANETKENKSAKVTDNKVTKSVKPTKVTSNKQTPKRPASKKEAK